MPRPTRRTRSISPAAATKASPRARTAQGVNLFDVVAEHVKAANAAGRRVLVAGYTEGSASRLQHLLQEHGATTPVPVADFATVQGLPPGALGVAVWPVEHGFVLDGLEVIGEEDILGDRLSRPAKKRRPSERFIAEAAALSEGDLVVHREHGVGRYEGLVTLEIQYARHDCLQADLRRRRQALRAGREHRRAEPLRLGGGGRGRSTGWAASPGSRARRGSSSASPTWPTG